MRNKHLLVIILTPLLQRGKIIRTPKKEHGYAGVGVPMDPMQPYIRI